MPSEAQSRKGRLLKSTLRDVLRDDPRAEVDRLLPHQFQQFGTVNAVLVVRRHLQAFFFRQGRVEIGLQVAGRKAGVVLHFGRQGQLSQRQGAGDPVFRGIGPLEHQGLQFRASGVNGRRPGGRAAADDDQFFRHGFGSTWG